MKQELDRYFKEARENIKDTAVLESVVAGMKAVIIESTGDCPCGDPDCNGHCKYGLAEEVKEEPKVNEEPTEQQEQEAPTQEAEEMDDPEWHTWQVVHCQ